MPWKTFKGSLFRAIWEPRQVWDKQKSFFPLFLGSFAWKHLTNWFNLALPICIFCLVFIFKVFHEQWDWFFHKVPTKFFQTVSRGVPKPCSPAGWSWGLGLGSSALSPVPRRQGSRLQEGQGSSLEKKLTQGITAPLKNKDAEKTLKVKATKAETGRTFRVSLKPRRASLVAKMAKNCLQCGRPRIGEPGELQSMGLQRVQFLKPRKWAQPGNCLGFLVRPMHFIPSCFFSRTLEKCANAWVSPVWYLKSCQGYESGPCFKIQMKDSYLSIFIAVTVW